MLCFLCEHEGWAHTSHYLVLRSHEKGIIFNQVLKWIFGWVIIIQWLKCVSYSSISDIGKAKWESFSNNINYGLNGVWRISLNIQQTNTNINWGYVQWHIDNISQLQIMWIQGTGWNTWPCWSKWQLVYTIVGTVTRLWAGRCRIHGSIFSRSKRFSLLQKCPDQLCCPSMHTFHIQ